MRHAARAGRTRSVLALVLLLSSQSGCFLFGYEGLADQREGDGSIHWQLDAALDGSWGITDGGGHEHEGGQSDDAGPALDADLADTSVPHDDGGEQGEDAGRDAGNPVDAGETDAGQQVEPDGGAPSDAGHTRDAGSPDDAGQSADAGTPADAGQELDAGGQLDAGQEPEPDAGVWWDGKPPTESCSSIYCSMQCSAAESPCVLGCSSPSCIPSCAAGTQCHTQCSGYSCVNSCGTDADCHTSCNSTQCSTTCAAGSSCEFDCIGAVSCTVTCALGAECLARCSGVCEMTCEGAQLSCPNGVITCDRDCP